MICPFCGDDTLIKNLDEHFVVYPTEEDLVSYECLNCTKYFFVIDD